MKGELVFVKLGGSLITDKMRPETPRPQVIARLATEVRQALDARPDLALLLGHGSGSFGHWLGERYGTRAGVRGREEWVGYAHVAATAARLCRLVSDSFLEHNVPVLAVPPSASACCRDGVLVHLHTETLRRALEEDLVPLTRGDVALDQVRGGTIVSTEEVMAFLADALPPSRILLLGETEGVLGADGRVIPVITPENIAAISDSLGGARGMDVTGGMLGKVRQMLALVQQRSALVVHIFSGLRPGQLTHALLHPDAALGTRIQS